MNPEAVCRTHCHAVLLACFCIAACGGSRVIDTPPEALILHQPLASASDLALHADLSWIIIRNGNGSWATDADWDEYIFGVTNHSASVVRITTVTAFDSLDNARITTSRRPALIKQTRDSAKRYKGHGLTVKAGVGGDTLMLAGAATNVAGTTAALSMLYGSMSTSAAAASIGAAFIVAPALIVGGTMRNIEQNKIAEMLIERQSNLPVLVNPGETQEQHYFFPITPSPLRVEIVFLIDGKQQQLVIDTASALQGLHLSQATIEK